MDEHNSCVVPLCIRRAQQISLLSVNNLSKIDVEHFVYIQHHQIYVNVSTHTSNVVIQTLLDWAGTSVELFGVLFSTNYNISVPDTG